MACQKKVKGRAKEGGLGRHHAGCFTLRIYNYPCSQGEIWLREDI